MPILRNQSLNYSEELGFTVTLEVLHALSAKECYCLFKRLFNSLPHCIQEHRTFYEQKSRGFGERAFHSFWYWLVAKYIAPADRSLNFLEIGVYRGQTLTLIPLIGKQIKSAIYSAGISPFSSDGDSVSSYLDIDYYADVQENAMQFGVLDNLELITEYSTSEGAKHFISGREWDLIYIDGSHEYNVVKSDISISLQGLRKGGILVMDDSSKYLRNLYRNPSWCGFLGHEGPSKAIHEISKRSAVHFLTVGHLNAYVKL